ncbi:MAG: lysylphosphatidylglycerol synthase transmembrane domain-containing protein [Fibrobacter sp.]|nr:lysylphosphatidylglycerol synthase transmembrane domain-containing protein [Fibrobacter sp.]
MKISITVLVIALLVGKLGWSDIIKTVSEAKWSWLFASVGVFALSSFIGVFQWRILLANRGIELAFWRTFRLYFIGMFFNNFVLGGIVGDAMKVASIKNRDGQGMAGLAATFLDRFAGLWAMCGFAVVGSLILLHKGALSDGKIGTAVLALFVTFILFGAIMVFLLSKPLQGFFFRCCDAFVLTRKLRVKEIISNMLIEMHDYGVLVRVAFLSVIIQFLRIAVHIMVAVSLGLFSIGNVQYFFIFVPIIAMIMVIPLPFGVRETAGGALFAMAGFPLDAAFVMGFLASLVGLAASFFGGLFFIAEKGFLSGRKNEKNFDSYSAS